MSVCPPGLTQPLLATNACARQSCSAIFAQQSLLGPLAASACASRQPTRVPDVFCKADTNLMQCDLRVRLCRPLTRALGNLCSALFATSACAFRQPTRAPDPFCTTGPNLMQCDLRVRLCRPPTRALGNLRSALFATSACASMQPTREPDPFNSPHLATVK